MVPIYCRYCPRIHVFKFMGDEILLNVYYRRTSNILLFVKIDLSIISLVIMLKYIVIHLWMGYSIQYCFFSFMRVRIYIYLYSIYYTVGCNIHYLFLIELLLIKWYHIVPYRTYSWNYKYFIRRFTCCEIFLFENVKIYWDPTV